MDEFEEREEKGGVWGGRVPRGLLLQVPYREKGNGAEGVEEVWSLILQVAGSGPAHRRGGGGGRFVEKASANVHNYMAPVQPERKCSCGKRWKGPCKKSSVGNKKRGGGKGYG